MIRRLSKLPTNQSRQRGATLFVALIMLLVLTLVGLSASQRSSLQERMAANMHLDNMTFNAAESAVSAFLEDANTGDPKSDPLHVLNLVLANQDIGGNQIDFAGIRRETAFLDGNLAEGSLVASITPSVVTECQSACPGFSLDTQPDISCRIYLFEGQGQLVKNGEAIRTSNTSLFVKQITPCF